MTMVAKCIRLQGDWVRWNEQTERLEFLMMQHSSTEVFTEAWLQREQWQSKAEPTAAAAETAPAARSINPPTASSNPTTPVTPAAAKLPPQAEATAAAAASKRRGKADTDEPQRPLNKPKSKTSLDVALQAATRVKNSYLMHTSQATAFLSNCRAGGAWQWALWGDEIQLEAVRNAVGALQEVMKDPFLGQCIGVGIEKPNDYTESAKFEVDCERLTSEVKPLIDNLVAEIAKLKRMHSARSK